MFSLGRIPKSEVLFSDVVFTPSRRQLLSVIRLQNELVAQLLVSVSESFLLWQEHTREGV